MTSEVRVRFAPSPTGYLHVGGARTALFNWLFAKNQKGKFIVRIEDTDQTRYSPQAQADLLRDLKWMGLQWDEGPEIGGDYGPYQQSQRLEIYSKYAKELLNQNKAYRCFCSSERLAALREQQEQAGEATGYDRRCRNLSEAEIQTKLNNNEPYVIRLKVTLDGELTFKDFIRGNITTPNNILDDFVLYKTDGFPTYHLASVIDDHEMKISHVLRGDEWIPSTSRHTLLYQAFGWKAPEFVHLPVILAQGGGKLSKRKGAASVGDYEAKGYLPEALFNFLALLGWSPGEDREKMTLDEMISLFSLERIQAKSAAFDEKKLEWLNSQYFIQAPGQTYLKEFKEEWLKKGIQLHQDDTFLIELIDLVKERWKLKSDLTTTTNYFFLAPTEFDPKTSKKAWKEDTPKLMEELASKIAAMECWDVTAIESVFQELLTQKDIGFGKLGKPARLAITGLAGGPSLYHIIYLLGKEESLTRLNKAPQYLNK